MIQVNLPFSELDLAKIINAHIEWELEPLEINPLTTWDIPNWVYNLALLKGIDLNKDFLLGIPDSWRYDRRE